MKILITAGPTREPLDPIRFFSNRSTGQMGYALAEAALEKGHEVTLVSGPVNLTRPAHERLTVEPIESAEELRNVTYANAPGADAVIMTAAVADLTPVSYSKEKLKKEKLRLSAEGHFLLPLKRTPDILSGLRDEAPGAVIVGFAAETDHHEKNAWGKLHAKRCDLMALNDVSRADIGFGAAENQLLLLYADGRSREIVQQSKLGCAREIILAVEELAAQKSV